MNSKDREHLKRRIQGIMQHFALILLIIVALSVVLVHLLPTHLKVNTEDYYNGVVTLSTGAMIAIFLAVFYSDAERVEFIREKATALVLFVTILLDLILIVLSGLLIDINRTNNIIVLTALTALLFDLVWLIVRLMFIALKVVR